jgi:hypothetical protein
MEGFFWAKRRRPEKIIIRNPSETEIEHFFDISPPFL